MAYACRMDVIIEDGRNDDDEDAAAPSQVVLDALPYVDPINEDYEQYAAALIEQEMANSNSSAAAPLLPVHFRTPLMKEAYEKYSQRQASASSSGNPPPPQKVPNFATAFVRPPTNNNNSASSVEEWTKAVQNARVCYEIERIRGTVLEVQKNNDSSAGSANRYRQYNDDVLAKNAELLRAAAAAQRASVDEINFSRQNDQQKIAQELHVLQTQYEEGTRKLFSLKEAVYELEQHNEVRGQQAQAQDS